MPNVVTSEIFQIFNKKDDTNFTQLPLEKKARKEGEKEKEGRTHFMGPG